MKFVIPDWAVPDAVRAVVTTREFGNLARHAGDPAQVQHNRSRLVSELGLPRQPMWLNQVHGADVALAAGDSILRSADAAVTGEVAVPLVVMVADCLPVLLTTSSGSQVGVVHAGWRGLASGIVEAAVRRFDPDDVVIAWLGPAIGPCHYEVDDKVRSQFDDEAGFATGRDDRHWMMDLYTIARGQLASAGVSEVYGGGFCTCCDERFYSHRRDPDSGRFAAIIWKEKE